MENRIAIVTGLLGSAVSFMFDLVGVAISILVLMMFIDQVTGFIVGIIKRDLDFMTGVAGFLKKVYILLLLGAIYAMEFAAARYTDLEILGGFVGDGVTWAYIAIELISITENGVRMNAPIPAVVKDLLRNVKEKTGYKEEEGDK